jgi:endonuclease YncB( thermonuclease family)
METKQVKVQSLIKRSTTEPWIVSYVAPSGAILRTPISVTDGGVTVGPRLNGVLSSIERKITTYPFQYVWTDFLNDGTNLFNARLDGDKAIHLESGISLSRLLSTISQEDNSSKGMLDLIPIATDDVATLSASEFTIMADTDGLPTNSNGSEAINKSDWLIVGRYATKDEFKDPITGEPKAGSAIDGDTIDGFKILRVGKKISEAVHQFTVNGQKNKSDGSPYAYETPLKAGDVINVRFQGINAPETLEHGYTQGVQRNSEYCTTYHVSSSQAFQVGQEAWDFTVKALEGDGLIVLEADSKKWTDDSKVDHDLISMDKYGRLTAAVYKTSEKDENVFFEGKSIYGTNVCKTLMGSMSTIVPNAPLVIPYYHFIDDDPGRIDVNQWLIDVGIRRPDSDYKLGDRLAEEKKLKNKEAQEAQYGPLDDGHTVTVKFTESYNNQIDFIIPEDDRVEEGFGLDHRVRIGDVALTIPPLAIEVNSTSNITKIKTLRSKSSMMIKTGASTTTLTLQLYFHDLDSINGHKTKFHDDVPDRHYFMDGLRPLIAQFKKAPFLPIDNKYINEKLGIQSVALVNLSVQTVPGFPHSLSATLVLAEFEHEAYMPQESHLGAAINYPLLRWYYNEAMRDDIKEEDRSIFKTYLKPIPEEGLTNDFTFQIVDEQDLIDRKQAIREMRYMDDPQTAEAKFKNPSENGVSNKVIDKVLNPMGNTYEDGEQNPMSTDNTKLGRLYADGWAAQHVFDMYNKYMELKSEGKIDTDKIINGWRPGTGNMGDYIASYKHANDSKLTSLWKQIYGDNKTEDDIMAVSHYSSPETWMWTQEYAELIKATDEEHDDDALVYNGAIKIRLYEDSNIKLFPKKFRNEASKDGDFTVLIVPGTEIDTLNKIIDSAREAEKEYVKEVEKYKSLQKIANETESAFNLYDYTIDGLICTGLQVMYENQFSTAQLQELGKPTFQFLGGQDPAVQVEFEATEDALQKLKWMVEETERYAREYRTGITSGFIGVKNHLMQLFGVQTIMIENVQYRTVPGFPGRYQISLTLCGFDKTQKRTEQLNGISPVGQIPDSEKPWETFRETREASNYDPRIDEAIIEKKMRYLEVYPDLELPTYDELNMDLPYITTGFSIYENRTGGIYVDPDFYIATPVTVRELVRQKSKEETVLGIKDLTGVEMQTSSASPNMLDGSTDNWDLLNIIDGKSSKIDPEFSWDGEVSTKKMNETDSTPITFKSTDVKDMVDPKNRKNLKTPPTEAQFDAWGLSDYYRDYHSFVTKPNPSEQAVYAKIYALVDQHFSNYYYNDSNKDVTDEAWKKVTYCQQEDLANVSYNYLAHNHPKWLKKKIDDKTSNLTLDNYKATKNKIPRERLANICMAIIHARSRWKQFFATGLPMIDAAGNSAGIMGIPLASEAGDKDTALRFLWDWNYNMEYGFNQLIEGFKAALNKNDLKYSANPWDWMITAFATGSLDGAMENPFFNYVYTVFNAYYNKYECLYSTPTEAISMDIMTFRKGLTVEQTQIINKNKDALIAELKAAGYRKDKKNEKETLKWLDDQSENTVIAIYEDFMSGLFNTDAGKKTSEAVTNADGDRSAEAAMALIDLDKKNNDRNSAANPEVAANYELYRQVNDYMNELKNNNLVHQKSPQDIFPDLFIDMIRYDQKYRLLRAFPTFQMFIIDEGRWMTNYKLWDNLYGYNAIQSIDIHKSRKIAADTAVIQMTNIYSNLTSRALDTAYGEWDFKFWDNLVWGNPNEEIMDARKELLNSMYLQTGARIHLRMGYGSSVVDLPVIFNGTITEMDNSEIVQIVAQGDGLELTNVISGDPKKNSGNILHCTEPRDLICKLMTSKGNWLKDVINLNTGDEFFRENPLGIMHFGTPGATPPGNISWFNHEYGEAAQNIYSSNGLNTFSEYIYQDGSNVPYSIDGPVWEWGTTGDEDNVIVPFYNNTTWDIAQTIAYCSPDYIAAVHPFELRSTLFFGKPYWEMAYQYDSRYEWDESKKSWIRYRDIEHRKPYMQVHILDGTMDIISNKLVASTEGIYTNVIVNYDGHQSPLIQADWDIRFDRQTTTVIDAQIVFQGAKDKFTSANQALYYGASALRDYMKDMYKGEIVILGDPTIKPYDLIFLKDEMNDMHGNILCKAVTHHFSHETGFISSIQPDALVVNDDKAMLSTSKWVYSFGVSFVSFLMAKKWGAQLIKKVVPSNVMTKILRDGGNYAKEVSTDVLKKQIDKLPESTPELKEFKKTFEEYHNLPDGPDKEAAYKKLSDLSDGLKKKVSGWAKAGDIVGDTGKALTKKELKALKAAAGATENMLKVAKVGGKSLKYVGKIGGFLARDTPLTFIAAMIIDLGAEGISEAYRRKKAALQAVLMMPVTYQGRQYTAGINGHKGMVVGDAMGKLDSFYSGMGFNGKNGDSWTEYLMDAANWLTDGDSKDYSVTDEELQTAIYDSNK